MTVNLNKVTKVIPAEAAKVQAIANAVVLVSVVCSATWLTGFLCWLIAKPLKEDNERPVSK